LPIARSISSSRSPDSDTTRHTRRGAGAIEFRPHIVLNDLRGCTVHSQLYRAVRNSNWKRKRYSVTDSECGFSIYRVSRRFRVLYRERQRGWLGPRFAWCYSTSCAGEGPGPMVQFITSNIYTPVPSGYTDRTRRGREGLIVGKTHCTRLCYFALLRVSTPKG